MAIAKNKVFSLLVMFTLLLSLFTPNFASAYTIKGDANNPTITIKKSEIEIDSEKEEDLGRPLAGVEFTLTQTHSYDPETNQWTEVAADDGIKLIKTTGENGEVVFTKEDGLELGRYKVEETDGPNHVILNPDTGYIDIPMTSEDGRELSYDVTIKPKNEVIRGSAELIKKDQAGEALEGVKFGLYKENGDLIKELTTNAEGKISVEGLGVGKYYFQELETLEGLAINKDKIEFEVLTGEQNKVEWTAIDKFVKENGEVTNYPIPDIEKDVNGKQHDTVDRDTEYEYNITVKTPMDIEKYKNLGVTDELDERLFFTGEWSVEGVPSPEANIDYHYDEATNVITWEVNDLTVLTPGEDIKITFTAKIKPDAELNEGEVGIPNVAKVDFNNNSGSYTEKYPDPVDPEDPEDPEEPVTPPTTPPVTVDPTEGGLKVIKVDKDDNAILLPGAEFKLTTDEAGDNVVNAEGTVITVNGEEHSGLLENLQTREDGTFTIEGLTPGTYYLHETKAPTYIDGDVEKPYRLLTKPVEVTIVDNQDENLEVTVENSKSGWELPTTGGIGTILFTIIGLALMGIALYAYIRRKEPAQE